MRWGTKRVPALGGSLVAALLIAALALPAMAAGKTVHITKSESDGDAVAGATFTLYVDAPPVGNGPPKGAEDTAVAGTCTTAANGQCDITNVPPGDYWVSETGPPAGYTPAADSTLKVKKKNREVLVVNDKTPTNTSVNDPTADASVEDGTHIFQFGPSVAATPDGRNVLVAYNDSTGFFGGGGVSGIGTAFSSDFGQTFTDLGKVPPGPSSNFLTAEPSVIWDPVAARFLIASGSFVVNGSSFTQPILVVRTDGTTFGTPVNVFPGIATGGSAHNPRLNRWGDYSMLSFTYSHGDGMSEGMVTTSTDGGQTWGSPVSVTGLGTNDFISASGGPDGRIFATWTDYGGASSPTNDFLFSTSEDGGATWSPPRTIAEDVPKSGSPTMCGTADVRAYLGRVRTADAPRIAVSPFHPNRIFVTYPGQGGPGDESDLFISTSLDGGATWSEQPLVGPPDVAEVMPDLQVTPGGSVDLAFYLLWQTGLEVSLQVSRMSAFAGADTAGSLRADIEVAPPTPLWNMEDPFDTAWSPCIGLQGLQAAAPGSGLFVAWVDGRDAGPAGNDGVDPNIFFSRIEGPSFVTATSVAVSRTSSRLRVSGTVSPTPIFGSDVEITLFRDAGNGFRKLKRVTVGTGAGGRFSASFARPGSGTCRVTAAFQLAPERMPSSKTTTFAC